MKNVQVKENYREVEEFYKSYNTVQRISKEREQRKSYFRKQRILGIIMILCGTSLLYIGVGDGLWAVLLGLWICLTKSKVFYF